MSGSLSKLIAEAKPYAGLFAFGIVCMFFGGMSAILPSWFVKISIDGLAALEEGRASFDIVPTQFRQHLNTIIEAPSHALKAIAEFISALPLSLEPSQLHIVLPLSIIAVVLLEAMFKFLYQLSIRNLSLNVVRDLRAKFHAHMNKLSLATQAKYDSGSLVSVVTSDLHNLQSWIAESISNIFNDGFKALFLFAWLLVLDYKLTLLTLVIIPLFALPVLYLGKQIRAYSRQGQDYIGTLTSFVAESLHNQKILKAFNLENWRQEKFIQESNTLFGLHRKWVLFMAMVSPSTNIIAAIGVASILFFGFSAVSQGAITVGEFSSFFVTSILLYDPVKRIGRASTIIQSSLGVADRVFMILEEKQQQDCSSKYSSQQQGAIEFRNVGYSYQIQPAASFEHIQSQTIQDGLREQLFSNLSFKIPARTSLALVGPSGGGKTTLASLLPRFYEINSGEILIDGVNIYDLSLDDLRSQIALVTQEPLLFSGTIRENIALDHNASEAAIEEAARKAHVLEFAQELERGLDTDIGERGQNLSIGQRQRLSLARAFMSQAPIVILDEPTSALDNESQALVQDAISQLMQERTVIIIAHRLATVESCDLIFYIEDGEIKEQGSHQDLLKLGSSYARLLK